MMHEGLLTNKMKAGIIGASLLATTTLLAEEKGKYDPGASDTEIKIGQAHSPAWRRLVLGRCGSDTRGHRECT